MINDPVATWPLSEVVAQQISRLRKAANMTREQLAAACQAAGAPESLSAAAIANIETGRKDQAGRRRREVTVEELAIFGRALKVPPLLLLLPFDRFREIELLPKTTLPAWEAAQWFTGRAPWPHWQHRDETGEVVAEVGDGRDLEAYEQGAAAVRLWEEHDRELAQWRVLMHRTKLAQADVGLPDLTEAEQRQARRDIAKVVENLRGVRQQMRRHGTRLPDLPAALRPVVDAYPSGLDQAVFEHYQSRQSEGDQ